MYGSYFFWCTLGLEKSKKLQVFEKSFFAGCFWKIDFLGSSVNRFEFKRIYSDSAFQAEQEYIFHAIFNLTVCPPVSPETLFFPLLEPLFVNFSQFFPEVLGSISLCHLIRQMLPYKSIRVDFWNFSSLWKKAGFTENFAKIWKSL